MTQQKSNIESYAKAAAIVLGGYIMFSLAKKFGIIKNAAETQAANATNAAEIDAEQDILNVKKNSVWDYNNFFAVAPNNALIITGAGTDNYIKTLQDAYGYGPLLTTEEDIYGVFRNLKTQSQISWLAKKYFEKTNADLLFDLDYYMYDSEIGVLNDIINSKPLYNV